jgi:hypothetical protein
MVTYKTLLHKGTSGNKKKNKKKKREIQLSIYLIREVINPRDGRIDMHKSHLTQTFLICYSFWLVFCLQEMDRDWLEMDRDWLEMAGTGRWERKFVKISQLYTISDVPFVNWNRLISLRRKALEEITIHLVLDMENEQVGLILFVKIHCRCPVQVGLDYRAS